MLDREQARGLIQSAIVGAKSEAVHRFKTADRTDPVRFMEGILESVVEEADKLMNLLYPESKN
jgi:hypothetical protein